MGLQPILNAPCKLANLKLDPMATEHTQRLLGEAFGYCSNSLYILRTAKYWTFQIEKHWGQIQRLSCLAKPSAQFPYYLLLVLQLTSLATIRFI
jgi:hypothetical protein